MTVANLHGFSALWEVQPIQTILCLNIPGSNVWIHSRKISWRLWKVALFFFLTAWIPLKFQCSVTYRHFYTSDSEFPDRTHSHSHTEDSTSGAIWGSVRTAGVGDRTSDHLTTFTHSIFSISLVFQKCPQSIVSRKLGLFLFVFETLGSKALSNMIEISKPLWYFSRAILDVANVISRTKLQLLNAAVVWQPSQMVSFFKKPNYDAFLNFSCSNASQKSTYCCVDREKTDCSYMFVAKLNKPKI